MRADVDVSIEGCGYTGCSHHVQRRGKRARNPQAYSDYYYSHKSYRMSISSYSIVMYPIALVV